MIGVEYVRHVCEEKGVKIAKLERDLGFGNGYLNPKRRRFIPFERAEKIAKYLDADLEKIVGFIPLEYKANTEPVAHYIDDETAEIAQEIFKNKELRALFSAARDADADDLKVAHDMLLALKRKERGE